MLAHSTLAPLLAPATLVPGRIRCRRAPLDALLAWGRKPSGRAAEAIARRRGLPLWRLEDGFLRSLGLGCGEPPLSLLVDDLGVHYDATSPSRLEALIAAPVGTSVGERRHSRWPLRVQSVRGAESLAQSLHATVRLRSHRHRASSEGKWGAQ